MTDQRRKTGRGQGVPSPLQPTRPSRAARRRAGLHRYFTIAMMSVLALMCISLIGVFVIESGMVESVQERIDPPAPEVQVSRKSVKMVQPTVTGFDRKSQAYQLTADSARQDPNDPATVLLEKVNANLNMKKEGDVVNVVADTGTYNSERETLILMDNIKISSTNGYTAYLSAADVFLKEGKVLSGEPVRVEMPGGTIEANGVELLNDGDNIRFLNRARMILPAKQDNAG